MTVVKWMTSSVISSPLHKSNHVHTHTHPLDDMWHHINDENNINISTTNIIPWNSTYIIVSSLHFSSELWDVGGTQKICSQVRYSKRINVIIVVETGEKNPSNSILQEHTIFYHKWIAFAHNFCRIFFYSILCILRLSVNFMNYTEMPANFLRSRSLGTLW